MAIIDPSIYIDSLRNYEMERQALESQIDAYTYKDPRVIPRVGKHIQFPRENLRQIQEERKRTFFDELRSGKWREVDKEKAADLISLGMDVYILGCDSDSPFRISSGEHRDLPKWYITKFVINKHSDAYSFLVKVEE